MKVLFDFQIFELQKFGGISRYFLELIKQFAIYPDVQWELPITYSSNHYLQESAILGKGIYPKFQLHDDFEKFFWGINFKGKSFLFGKKLKLVSERSCKQSQANQAESVAKLKEGNFDVFHPTFFDDYFLAHIGNRPFVLTVHDLIHQVFPELYIDELKDRNQTLLSRATQIISVSESTKRDLVNLFGVDERKISVIYHANSLTVDESSSGKFNRKLPDNYLLYVGNREGYKNFLFLCQVVAVLNTKGYDLNIVCSGPPATKHENFFFEQLGIKNRIFNYFTNDAELVWLYKHAIALVFPSMYEGFGIPVLEAFSCGCPVLVSNTSSFPEVCEDAAIYFEPKNGTSIMNAIKLIVDNTELRNKMIEKGFSQTEKFLWQESAKRTLKVYESAIVEVSNS